MRISDWSSDVCSSDLKAAQAIVDAPTVMLEAGIAVLAVGDEPVDQLDLRRREVGRDPPAAADDRDQGIRLVRPGPQDSARPVIFERAPHQMETVGEQRGGKRVARKAFI